MVVLTRRSGFLVAEAAARLIGTPFRHRGRTEEGLDCFGLVALAYRRGAGMELPEIEYGPRPTSEFVVGNAARVARNVPRIEAKIGDVAVLRLGERTTHLGIIGGKVILHAMRPIGVAATPLDEILRRRALIAVFRPEGAPWQR